MKAPYNIQRKGGLDFGMKIRQSTRKIKDPGKSLHKSTKRYGAKRIFISLLLAFVLFAGNFIFPGIGELFASAAAPVEEYLFKGEWQVEGKEDYTGRRDITLDLNLKYGGIYEVEISYITSSVLILWTNLYVDAIGHNGVIMTHTERLQFLSPFDFSTLGFWGTHKFDMLLPAGKCSLYFYEPEELGDNIYLYVFQIKVTLKTPQTRVTSINITAPGDKTVLKTGESIKLSAHLLPANAEFKDILWSVVNSGVGPWHGQAAIDADGTLHTYASGQVEVRATSTDGFWCTGTYQITIAEDYEAEDYLVEGSIGFDPNCSGGAFTETKSDLNLPAMHYRTGVYDITFRYANGTTEDATYTLYIKDGDYKFNQLIFRLPPTGSWNTWVDYTFRLNYDNPYTTNIGFHVGYDEDSQSYNNGNARFDCFQVIYTGKYTHVSEIKLDEIRTLTLHSGSMEVGNTIYFKTRIIPDYAVNTELKYSLTDEYGFDTDRATLVKNGDYYYLRAHKLGKVKIRFDATDGSGIYIEKIIDIVCPEKKLYDSGDVTINFGNFEPGNPMLGRTARLSVTK